MPKEQLKDFLDAVKADAELQEQLKAAGDAAAVAAIAKAAGFLISSDEIKKAQSEVSEEELEGVTGGFADSDLEFEDLNLNFYYTTYSGPCL